MASSSSNEVAAVPFSSLKDCMKDLFDSKDGSDVTFVVHGQDLRAHRFIVTRRSPVLKAMIEGPMAPSDQRHLIEDPEISYEEFENFLLFLYLDKSEMEESNIRSLLHLGNFYDIPLLIHKCVEKVRCELKMNGDYDAIFRYAEMGLKYAPDSLMLKICLNRLSSFERNNFSLNYQSAEGELKWLSSDLVMEFVQHFSRNCNCTEDDVFRKVMVWCNNEALGRAQGATTENVREIMLPFMAYLDASKFRPLTVATTVKTFKLLSDEELIQCFADHVLKLVENENSSRLSRNGRNGDNNGYSGYGNRQNPPPSIRGPPAQVERNRYVPPRIYPAFPDRFDVTDRDEFALAPIAPRYDPTDRDALPSSSRNGGYGPPPRAVREYNFYDDDEDPEFFA